MTCVLWNYPFKVLQALSMVKGWLDEEEQPIAFVSAGESLATVGSLGLFHWYEACREGIPQYGGKGGRQTSILRGATWSNCGCKQWQ